MARGAVQSEACPFCGLVYGRWHPKILSYSEAYVLVFRESERRAERGDYSYPASRRHVLALLRLVKLEAFDEHVYQCGEAADLEAQLAPVNHPSTILVAGTAIGVEDEVPF